MIQLTDDELGDRLTEAFAAAEHLADPDRAVEIASSPGRASHRGRVLLATAAAVALVAGGATYVATRDDTGQVPLGEPSLGPSHGPQPPLPPTQTEAGNHALAVRTAAQIVSATPVFPGAREVSLLNFPELSDNEVATPLISDHTVVTTRLWSVHGVTPRSVAQWYADHPPRGFHTVGGHAGVGSEGSGPGTVDEVTWNQPLGDRLPPVRPWVEVFATRVADGRVGIRVTVYAPWPPARPAASYVQDVRSIDVTSRHTHYGQHVRTTSSSSHVSAPGQVLRAAVVFNDLPAVAPLGPIHCPEIRDTYTDRIVFHTATGDVVGVAAQGCSGGVRVMRDGHQVGPVLDDAAPLLRVLGVHH